MANGQNVWLPRSKIVWPRPLLQMAIAPTFKFPKFLNATSSWPGGASTPRPARSLYGKRLAGSGWGHINFPSVHFLASLTTALSGDPKKYLSSPGALPRPSRRLCSDIICFSPQKHLNCLKTLKNLRTFEDTHHSDWGHLQAKRMAFELQHLHCARLDAGWPGSLGLNLQHWKRKHDVLYDDLIPGQLCWGCYIWNCVLGPLGLGFCYDWAPSWENLGYPDWACHEATASGDGDLEPQNHSRNVKFYQWAQ
jgi:hypothetical protein